MKSRWLLLGMIIVYIACLTACKKEKPLSPIPDSLASFQDLLNPIYQISTDSIRKELRQIRTLQVQQGKTRNRLLANIEYQLTSAYLSYVCQLKFGFLPSKDRWNDSISRIPLKDYDKNFAMAALDSLRVNANTAFHKAQPSSLLYHKMQEELGVRLQKALDFYRELKHYSLEKYIPLFVDYQTVYLSADNNLRYCEDIYKYDPSILKAMNDLNLKP